jgi:hypothetical protein
MYTGLKLEDESGREHVYLVNITYEKELIQA